jgi:hypothetical protein
VVLIYERLVCIIIVEKNSSVMNNPPEIPPVIGHRLEIAYELTRWDLFANYMTVIFRNRILQVFVIVALIFNGWVTLAPGLLTRPISYTVLAGIIFLIVFGGLLALCMGALGLATSFLLKQRGLVGKHVLRISDQGLVESTEFNESLHKWPSVCRILSLWGYLYIYVSDMNTHQVPKRCFSPKEIADFEAALRAYAKQARIR